MVRYTTTDMDIEGENFNIIFMEKSMYLWLYKCKD